MEIPQILQRLASNSPQEALPLFQFRVSEVDELIIYKFGLWVRYFFPKYIKGDDAPFHHDIDCYNLAVYKGHIKSFTDIAFRNAAKSTRTKLFAGFCIANDLGHFRRYLKVLSKDGGNSKQATTDIYNMFMEPRVHEFYPDVFKKTAFKREETMGSFTTATGVKVLADTVGTDQRGQIQEEARPDWIWFDDFETRKSLRSAVETKAIWDNMDEAVQGLAKGGGAIYTCNYISERGNVHKLVQKADAHNVVLITPIMDKSGNPTWPIYTKGDIEVLKKNAEDFEGDYMCEPSASLDVFFTREDVDRQVAKKPIKDIAGFKVFHAYDPAHRYGGGMDVGGGVGLDHSTSVFIDFSTIPNKVVGTFKSNTIKPDAFGHEIEHEALVFGRPTVAPENNRFDMCIGVLKQIYDRIYFTVKKDETKTNLKARPSEKTYGWNTNSMTKPKMLYELRTAVKDGLLELSDPDLIAEARSYTRDDLMDTEADPRLSTRHFDLLIACAIAWQMRNHAEIWKRKLTDLSVAEGKQDPKYGDIGI